MSEVTVIGPQGVESESVDVAAGVQDGLIARERQMTAASVRRSEQREAAQKWTQEYAEEQARFLRDSFRGRERVQDGTSQEGTQ